MLDSRAGRGLIPGSPPPKGAAKVKAKVIKPCWIQYQQRKPGDLVELTYGLFKELEYLGRVELAPEPKKDSPAAGNAKKKSTEEEL